MWFRFAPVLLGLAVQLAWMAEPNWTYEFLYVKVNNSNTDKMDLEMQVDRINRTHWGLSLYWNNKQDLTDDLLVEVIALRSTTGSSNYILLPLRIPQSKLTKAMNFAYRNYLMPSIKECAPTAPQFEEFVPPLRKGVIKAKKCIISNHALPSQMASGYYKIILTFAGQAELSVELLAKVESKLF